MNNHSDWLEMKRHAFLAYANEGRMSASILEQIVRIGCADGEFDEREKAVLISVISKLTRADMNDEMWAMVDDLIHKFELGYDSEASIESLDESEL